MEKIYSHTVTKNVSDVWPLRTLQIGESFLVAKTSDPNFTAVRVYVSRRSQRLDKKFACTKQSDDNLRITRLADEAENTHISTSKWSLQTIGVGESFVVAQRRDPYFRSERAYVAQRSSLLGRKFSCNKQSDDTLRIIRTA